MRRTKIYDAYNSNHLSMKNPEYKKKALDFLENELQEDLRGGDATTEALFSENKIVTAYIKAKQKGVIAGLEEISVFYRSHGLKTRKYKRDGDTVKKGQKVLRIKGDVKTILELERTGLNLLQRMSGIATTTRNLKDKIKGYNTEIAATRKTQLRYLDKRAVMLGRGMAHRMGLYDGIMIKDTHLDALKEQWIEETIDTAIELATKEEDKNLKFIEIEVSNLEEAVKAAKKFKKTETKTANIIMLDNMTPEEIKKVIYELKEENTYDSVLLEASGMINENNIKKYAKSGVDVISMGCLTHSVTSLDLSQKIDWRKK